MKLAYIRWKDAVAEEASDSAPRPSQAKLVGLQEIGFLLDENEEAVEIGMELTEDDEVRPGRWRLHIPRQHSGDADHRPRSRISQAATQSRYQRPIEHYRLVR
jgi:hypothetical protein